MATFAIVDCGRCEYSTPILFDVFRQLSGDLGAPKDKAFVDFVCPKCGFGSRRLLDSFRRDEFGYTPPSAILYPIEIFHESLQCDRKCFAHGRVHTLAETSAPDIPRITISKWNGMTGITCSLGHPLRVPCRTLAQRFRPDEADGTFP